jgi:hypothetical protein
MLEIPQIRSFPDVSLCLEQGATVERGVCLILGTLALIGFIALTMENLPLSSADVMVFVSMLGLFAGALIFPSSQVRFDSRAQKLFHEREQWGRKRERQCDFAGIKSLRRVERYGTGEIGLRVHFWVNVGGEELPLPNALSPGEADELEARLRALLPDCPFETSSPLGKAENLPPLSSRKS